MKAKEIRDKYKNEMGVSYKDNDSKIRLGYIYWLENKVEEYSHKTVNLCKSCETLNHTSNDRCIACNIEFTLPHPPNNQADAFIEKRLTNFLIKKSKQLDINLMKNAHELSKEFIQDLKHINKKTVS